MELEEVNGSLDSTSGLLSQTSLEAEDKAPTRRSFGDLNACQNKQPAHIRRGAIMKTAAKLPGGCVVAQLLWKQPDLQCVDALAQTMPPKWTKDEKPFLRHHLPVGLSDSLLLSLIQQPLIPIRRLAVSMQLRRKPGRPARSLPATRRMLLRPFPST